MRPALIRALFATWLTATILAPHAARGQSRQFGDIGVSAHALVSGNTFHGYFEFRFTLLNSNPSQDHTVTIELPARSANRSRDAIQRMRRTVKVAGGRAVSLPILQPALPIDGGNVARVYVDGKDEGELPLSGGLNHGNLHSGSIPPRPYLVSRSLDSSALDTALTKMAGGTAISRVDYSAFQATGAPNVPAGRGGYHGNAWIPENPGGSDWLELRYTTQLKPERVRVFRNGKADALERIEFLDDSGAVISTVTNTGASSRFDNQYTPLELKVSGVTQAVHRVRIDFNGRSGSYLGVDAVELIGDGVRAYATGATASSTYATRHSRGGKSSIDKPDLLRSELEVDEWSDNWLAYTAFDAIVLHGSDLRQMPPDVARAFWQYVEAGGVAAILGNLQFPKDIRARQDSTDSGPRRYFVGFGECLELDADDTRDLDAEDLRRLDGAGRRTGGVWPAFGDVATANSVFPVIDNLTIPVKGIALIMLLFIIAVGPLNIFLLARMNRRVWMLWTIPAISLVTCGIVFVYSLFSEGITPTIRVESVTLLDHESHRATTLGRLAYYCPLTPSDGLHFDYDTEIFPLVSRNWRDGTAKTIEWTSGQHLDNGWIQARMPAHFSVRKSETRRERIQFERDSNGAWTAMNGLGVTVKSLILRTGSGDDGKGRAFVLETGPIPPGAKAVLRPSPDQGGDNNRHATLRMIFKDGYWSSEAASKALLGRTLPDSAYVAELEENPFLEVGLEGKMHLNSSAIVAGQLSIAEVAL